MTTAFLLVYCHYVISTTLSCEGLFYPKSIKVNDGDTLRIKSIYLNTEIYDESQEDKTLMVDMTGRALCINDICSIPGPSLIVYPGNTIYIELENSFTNTGTDTTGPDVTNIHSHGLHISGDEDNVFEAVLPSQSISMIWNIHPFHHLGTNWYHTHHHGSTSLQVMQGMYGALIVDSLENKDLNYDIPQEINDYVIHISWQYLHDKIYCNDCIDFNKGLFKYSDSFKGVDSLCGTWCGYDETQREASEYKYDVILNGSENYQGDIPSLEAFLVNNAYQPTICSLKTNQYFKLRIISSSTSLYVQLHFDYNTDTNCKYSLIARDGVAIQDFERDLAEYPYFGAFLLPPGGRIDVLVICEGKGIATISHNELHSNYPNINVSYPMGRIDEQILFKLSIDEENEDNIGTIESHLLYPEPFEGFPYYLAELINATWNEIEEECPCSKYDREKAEDEIIKNTNLCALEFIEGGYDKFEVNGVRFGSDPDPLFIISLNKIYRFYINSDGHPFHIHVNPFMIENDLLNGYIAKKGDIMDTLGYNSINDTDKNSDIGIGGAFYMRYNARDYNSNVILHCHFLGHEDLGMMGFMQIVDDQTNDSTVCDNKYYGEDNADDGNGEKGGKGEKGEKGKKNKQDLESVSYSSLNWDFLSRILSILIIVTFVLNIFVCFLQYIQRKSTVF